MVGVCCVIVNGSAQEEEEAIIVEEGHRGAYCCVFDPLDGSSNIDAGVNMWVNPCLR